ncbi:hypothetical protein HYFRA_00008659 [Hymenoscyphus fraxineus]|uniref:Cytochrome P450 n=1 Tax=Hymenoscyphus fraxineus TaxID=746836 RepID=A0A9N9KVB6_9HELO|nr:hypothetical protein HYFRA_00008659 [Hymenoscyphus fraxineus]
MPADRPELAFMKWAEDYSKTTPYKPLGPTKAKDVLESEILYLNLLRNHVIVLNSLNSAKELLEKRGGKYSDRPPFHFFEEQGWVSSFPLSPNKKGIFRKHRKLFQNGFSPANCLQYRDVLQKQARETASNLIRSPTDWISHFERSMIAIIMAVAYGLDTENSIDDYVELSHKGTRGIDVGGTPGATAVDIFPTIRQLPKWLNLFPSLKLARESYFDVRALHDVPFEAAKKQVSNGTARPSFASKMFEEQRKQQQQENWNEMILDEKIMDEDINGAAAVLYIAGQHTGNFNHILGFPHSPKFYRSLVIANVYSMTHDPTVYRNPDTFDPDRYAKRMDGTPGEPLPLCGFGFGRRECPGQYFGTLNLWIFIATMLATVEFSKELDDNGVEVTPRFVVVNGLSTGPEPFPCRIVARRSTL